jgi:hypothetical protein
MKHQRIPEGLKNVVAGRTLATWTVDNLQAASHSRAIAGQNFGNSDGIRTIRILSPVRRPFHISSGGKLLFQPQLDKGRQNRSGMTTALTGPPPINIDLRNDAVGSSASNALILIMASLS